MTTPRIWTLLAGVSLVSAIACGDKDDDDNDSDGDGFDATIDCDDNDVNAYPGANEVCDGVDNDCDGAIDNDPVDGLDAWADADGDGFGDASEDVSLCEIGDGYADNDEDCDDEDATSFPGNAEVCDGADNDCNGTPDDNPTDGTAYYLDSDGDGFGDAADEEIACEAAADRVEDATDCDDSDGEVFPGAEEVCDGIDNDCDADIDESGATGEQTWYIDSDGDGYGDSNDPGTVACDAPSGTVSVGGDCDDSKPPVNPGATEVCDGVDTDCDPATSEDGMVRFTDAAGTRSDVTSTFSGGTVTAPAAVTMATEGTYTFCDGTYFVDLEIENDITLTSQSGGAALDGADSGSIINMGLDGLTVEISDLMLQNGNGDMEPLPPEEGSYPDSGGAIACSADASVASSSLLIDGVTFENNYATSLGGAIAAYGCDLDVTDSVFTANESAAFSGAAFIGNGSLTMDGSDVTDNTAPYVGGIYNYLGSGDYTDTLFDANSGTVLISALAGSGADLSCTGSSSTTSGFTSNAGAADNFAAVYLNDSSTFTATDCDFGSDPSTDANSPNDLWVDDADLPFKVMADDANFTCDTSGCGTQTVVETGGTPGNRGPFTLDTVYRGNSYVISGTPTIESFGVYLDVNERGCYIRFHVHELNGSTWDVLWSGTSLASLGERYVESPTVGLAFEDGDEILLGFSKDCDADYSGTTASSGDSYGFGDWTGEYWYASSGTFSSSYVPTNGSSSSYVYDMEVTYWEE